MPRYRWILLVSQTWITKPITDVYSWTVPRKAVMLSVFPAPFEAAVAMFSCCSMIAAPTAANPMIIAIVCRCRLFLSSLIASAPPTPSSSAPASDTRRSGFSMRRIATTSAAQSAMMLALTSSRLEVPTFVAKIVSDEPAMPPRLEPPPMNPKIRFACRGS